MTNILFSLKKSCKFVVKLLYMFKLKLVMFIILAIGFFISTVMFGLKWYSESFKESNVVTPIEPVVGTLFCFIATIFFLDRIYLFFD